MSTGELKETVGYTTSAVLCVFSLWLPVWRSGLEGNTEDREPSSCLSHHWGSSTASQFSGGDLVLQVG